MKFIHFCALIFLSFAIFSPGEIDASTPVYLPDAFIEKIHKIKIPDLNKAFGYNASLIEHEDGYLMAFTILEPHDLKPIVGLILLDDHFQPKGTWQPLLADDPYDPRLLKIDETMYLIFAKPNFNDPLTYLASNLKLCTIQYSPDGTPADNLISLTCSFQQKCEKNWILFEYKKKPHLVYSIDPFIVLKPDLQTGSCTEVSSSKPQIDWPYGILRGSTQALLVDGEYLSFFHSRKRDPQKDFDIYYVGAFTFSPNPPFNITSISEKPFCHNDFYSTQKNTLTHSDVIFPAGFVVKDDKVIVSYGENDGAIKIMVLDKKGLYKSLRKVMTQ